MKLRRSLAAMLVFALAVAFYAAVPSSPLRADTRISDGTEFDARTLRLVSQKVAATASEAVAGAMGAYVDEQKIDQGRAGLILRQIRNNRRPIKLAAGQGVAEAITQLAATRRIPKHVRARFDKFIRRETDRLISDMGDPAYFAEVLAGFSQVVDIGTKKQGSVNDVIRQRFLDHLEDQANALLQPPRVSVRKPARKKRLVRKKKRTRKKVRTRKRVTRRVTRRKDTRSRNARRRDIFNIGPRSGNFKAGRISF